MIIAIMMMASGSPVEESVKWSNLSRSDIAEKLKQHGFTVSVTVVDQLLDKHGFRRRQAFKVEVGKKNIPHRDEQFKNIEQLKETYQAQGNPVMSMDVKKKELIGKIAIFIVQESSIALSPCGSMITILNPWRAVKLCLMGCMT